MAKIRSIKPEFFISEQVATCSRDARLLFIGLWVFADDAGVHPASPHTLRLEVFPGDNDMTTERTAEYIKELITNKLVAEYEVGDERYWKIINFEKHQKINRPYYKHPLPSDDKNISKPIQTHHFSDEDMAQQEDQSLPKYSSDTAQALSEQCPNTPGNGNGNVNGNGNGNGINIRRVAKTILTGLF